MRPCGSAPHPLNHTLHTSLTHKAIAPTFDLSAALPSPVTLRSLCTQSILPCTACHPRQRSSNAVSYRKA